MTVPFDLRITPCESAMDLAQSSPENSSNQTTQAASDESEVVRSVLLSKASQRRGIGLDSYLVQPSVD
jgi:hypothetical protein